MKKKAGRPKKIVDSEPEVQVDFIENKTGRGRPKRTFDLKLLESLCTINCTRVELEFVLATNCNTLNAWCQRELGVTFNEFYEQFAARGKSSLRRYQFNLAKTNATMAIWLGKQWLGQKDDVTQLIEFNGKLGEILDKIGTVKDEKQFKAVEEKKA